MERSFLFYDIETSGLNKAFDQVLQFAAIRTDEQLNELERHEILVKLNPDCIPAPQAMITHRISLERLANEGIGEFEAIQKIHALLNTPGTMSVGYNTMGFDDEFLRFSFFRNLLPPYSHQYANQCSRFDIFPITIAYYLFNPESIHWPQIDGKVSLKLENLNAANHFTTGAAHDAIVDVIATVELARKLMHYREMWRYLLESFDKETDHARIAKLTSAFQIKHHEYKQALMIDSGFGNKNNFQSAVLNMGRHNHYKNQSVWLRLDHNDFSQSSPESLVEDTWVINKKPGDAKILMPYIPRFLVHLTPEKQALVNSNLAWLKDNLNLFNNITRHHLEYTHAKIPNVDADAALYQMGFLLPHETQLCQNFHQATNTDRLALIEQYNNPILREQAIRIIGRGHPELLSGDIKAEFEQYMAMINQGDPALTTVDYRGNHRLTLSQALHDIGELACEATLDQEQHELLEALEQYLIASFRLAQPLTSE